jgi:plastocyanin
MRVPPLRGPSLAWFLRGILLLGIVSLALVALVGARPQPTPLVEAPATVAPTPPPLPTFTPQPTQTPRPITSIIVRQTQEPYPTATPVPSGLASVSIVDFSYMPTNIRIRAGQSVLWRNDGTEQHDVTGSDWHSGPLDPGYTYRLTFGIAGTYAYRCSIHLDMTGTVFVT